MAAPGGARRWPLLLLLFGLVHGASAVFVVKDGNGTACIMANFSAAFLTSYDTKNGSKSVTFELPASAEVLNSSSCGKGNASDSSLVIAFGRGHTLTLSFTRNATRYSVQLMRFVYNLSDTGIFPNSSSKETKTVESVTDIRADINKKYRCVSSKQIYLRNVTITLRDATIQAYLSNDSFSTEETHCEQDGPSPPSPTAPPQPSPTPVPASPSVSRYNVSGTNGTCLLASMGLQLNVTYRTRDNTTVTREFNIDPSKTTFGGNCTARLVTLALRSGNLLLVLQFAMVRARRPARPAPGPSARRPARPAPGPSARRPARPAPGPSARRPARPAPGPSARRPARPAPGPSARRPARPAPGPSARRPARPTLVCQQTPRAYPAGGAGATRGLGCRPPPSALRTCLGRAARAGSKRVRGARKSPAGCVWCALQNASSSRVFLQGVQLTMTLPDARDPTFKAANNSLRALQATAGNSYKCNAEERVQVTEAAFLNVFRVWVQAFRVDGDKFGPVEECQLDENSMLIPIAVGGALAGLVLIVLIAYLIGRKRSHAGYQTI
ncbi:lysosome-associated membrane glycoprotein 1 isoform 2-T2 [Megaptera novaeangliae]